MLSWLVVRPATQLIQKAADSGHLIRHDQCIKIGAHKLRLTGLAVAQQLEILLPCSATQPFQQVSHVRAGFVDSVGHQRPSYWSQQETLA